MNEAARQLSLSRPLREVECLKCGNSFKARDPRAKYCSASCRQIAYKRRKRQATQ